MPQHIPTESDQRQTVGITPLPEADMPQETRTPGQTQTLPETTPRRGFDRVQIIGTVIALLLTAGVMTWIYTITRPTPAQPTPIPTPSANATAPASATATPVSQNELAYAAAEKTYRAWSTNYADAVTHYDPTKVDAALVTPQVLAQVKSQFARFAPVKDKITDKYTQDIKIIRGAKYEPNGVTITVCALTNDRFLDKAGKDVTLNPDGTPAPVLTEFRANDVTATSADGGKTWVISKLTTELDSSAGISC